MSAQQTAMPLAVQGTFDDLGTPLVDITFVVVDLETTGGSPAQCQITEVGAVKVRGGEVIGEFQSLVNPGEPIPAFIAVLTGITDATVAHAPPIEAVLPSFLEFARDAVLVAHNAPFDMGFLKEACRRQGIEWPRPAVLDTAKIARRTLDRDEAPNCKLATLAQLFRATTSPTHRALDDARATVDVLHGLFERLGCHGVTTLEDIDTFSTRVSSAQRRKRYLADGVPGGPGVYMFRDGKQRVLYVGKSVNMRARVKQYFTSSETRRRMAEMVGVSEEVIALPCATALEAEVRELRLIAEYKPRYNRRSRFPEKSVYLKVTVEPFPRLSIVRQVRDDATAYLGPFRSTRLAEAAATALLDAIPLRQCTRRLARTGGGTACLLAEMGRCGAPCEGLEAVDDYAHHVEAAVAAMLTDQRSVVRAGLLRIAPKVALQRFEEAARIRDRLNTLLHAAARAQRLRSLAASHELIAARPDVGGGWEIAVIRHGRLAAAGIAARGVAVMPFVDSLAASAELVAPAPAGFPSATSEESECILRWLDSSGVRLVALSGVWVSPVHGAAGLQSRLSLDALTADPHSGGAR